MPQGLFRQEAMEQHRDRLHGDVLLLPRFSHSLLATLLMLWVVAVTIWLTTSDYARKETVTGWLEPPAGVIRVFAEQPGTVKQVLVSEGDTVVTGQPLIIVNGDRMLADGDNLEVQLLNEYEAQRQLLAEQLDRTRSIYQRRNQDITQRITAAKQDVALLGEQITTLSERYVMVQAQVKSYRALKQSGHVSSIEFDNMLAQELALRSERQALLREQVERRNMVQQLHTELELLPDEGANAIDHLRARLSDIAQQVSQLHGRRAHIIKASRSGVVNNLQVREGQQANVGASTPLLTIMPENVELAIELLIPVRSVGFVEPNQTIDIRYDAFPYQKFGLYSGRVITISEAVLMPSEIQNAPLAIPEPVYRVTAALSDQHVRAYGREFSLKPGMTLSADIHLGERTLVQWLLEPLYSLRGRI